MKIHFLHRTILAYIIIALATATAGAEFNMNPEISVKLLLLEKQRSGDSKKNSRVNYKVDEDVVDKDGKVMIKKGTSAYGSVLNSRRAGMLGRRGSLDISVDYTTAVDGQKITLRASKEKRGGGSRGLITAGALLVAWPLLFCKGSNVSIDAGTTFVAYVNDSLNINTGNSSAPPDDSNNDSETTSAAKLITLKNGDRISGNIISLNNGNYSIKTSLGNLNVAEKEIANIQTIEDKSEPESLVKQSGGELQKRLEDLKSKKQQERKP